MNKMDEMILVAKRSELFDVDGVKDQLAFQGLNTEKNDLNTIIQRLSENVEVMRRGDAEENEEYKQPIPYVVIKRGNELYTYERLKGGGESRLHEKLSTAFGGHMNSTNDETFEDTLLTNLNRELEEELHIQASEAKLNALGLVNDDLEDVGRVHIGLLYSYELDDEAVIEVREKDQIRGFWIKIEDLVKEENYNRLENWSKFVADLLNK